MRIPTILTLVIAACLLIGCTTSLTPWTGMNSVTWQKEDLSDIRELVNRHGSALYESVMPAINWMKHKNMQWCITYKDSKPEITLLYYKGQKRVELYYHRYWKLSDLGRKVIFGRPSQGESDLYHHQQLTFLKRQFDQVRDGTAKCSEDLPDRRY